MVVGFLAILKQRESLVLGGLKEDVVAAGCDNTPSVPIALYQSLRVNQPCRSPQKVE